MDLQHAIEMYNYCPQIMTRMDPPRDISNVNSFFNEFVSAAGFSGDLPTDSFLPFTSAHVQLPGDQWFYVYGKKDGNVLIVQAPELYLLIPCIIVEIDESKFGKRKYGVGGAVEGQWVLSWVKS
ncbi:hypothetical protein BDC45DRAFT_530951 [Circinella umbellata]|nr:hypothetical protein BDC45DRAFT_530951 [Circinella umbellata]